jgi:hypothetical protein
MSETKIIVKQTCLACNGNPQTVDNTAALELFQAHKQQEAIAITPSLSPTDKYTISFLNSIRTAIVNQDISKPLMESKIIKCSHCKGEGTIETQFSMADAFTAMLTSALQDPDFITNNSELLKKLIPPGGTNGSST